MQKYILLIIQPEKTTHGAKANPEEIQQMYIMTPFYTAVEEGVIHSSDEPSVSGYAEGQ